MHLITDRNPGGLGTIEELAWPMGSRAVAFAIDKQGSNEERQKQNSGGKKGGIWGGDRREERAKEEIEEGKKRKKKKKSSSSSRRRKHINKVSSAAKSKGLWVNLATKAVPAGIR